MSTSKTKFVLIFLAAAFAFQFITNSLYLTEPRLFPAHGESFITAEAQSGWKNIVATILLPIKVVQIVRLFPLSTF